MSNRNFKKSQEGGGMKFKYTTRGGDRITILTTTANSPRSVVGLISTKDCDGNPLDVPRAWYANGRCYKDCLNTDDLVPDWGEAIEPTPEVTAILAIIDGVISRLSPGSRYYCDGAAYGLRYLNLIKTEIETRIDNHNQKKKYEEEAINHDG
jgi:hypothetical protein